MKEHRRPFTRAWMLPIGVFVLIAGHIIFFERLLHAGLSLAVILALVLLAIAKHLGLLGSLHALLRRRLRS